MQPKMQQCLNFYVFILVGTFDPETSVWVHVILNTKERLQFHFAFKH